MPMQWNDQADARLFSMVLKLHVVKLDYGALARGMGSGVTPKAISHRITKIKEKAKAYRRDHPYAFGPDVGNASKRKKTTETSTHAKDLFNLEDDQSGAAVKPEGDGGPVKKEEEPLDNTHTAWAPFQDYNTEYFAGMDTYRFQRPEPEYTTVDGDTPSEMLSMKDPQELQPEQSNMPQAEASTSLPTCSEDLPDAA